MKLLVKGWWALHSDSDPRWNKNGNDESTWVKWDFRIGE
jgi:hypothetical protein